MKHAFSLVELSIVLVILGLLTGGILAGQSLIRAAELRTVSRDMQRYTTALNAFRDKYFGLPGDIVNATAFWGDQATGTGACADAAVADGSPGTCNGNGDGGIGTGGGAAYAEYFRAWQQLALSGLIEGSLSGVAGAGSAYEHLPGTNCPLMKAGNNACWQLVGLGQSTGGSALFDGYYGNALRGGTYTAAQQPLSPILRPEEAWNIDTKMDDGIPSTGKVVSSKTGGSYSPNCTTSATAYALSTTSLECFIVYKTGL